ncbi:MAG: hypothetical protein Q7O66_06815 [Dehalococcoidia bacterium]|nr:hypothetical protein [Dehalococcoidia bacterium]
MAVIEYEGPMTVRPMFRGVHLDAWVDDWNSLEDIICRQLGEAYKAASGWSGHVKLRIELEEQT